MSRTGTTPAEVADPSAGRRPGRSRHGRPRAASGASRGAARRSTLAARVAATAVAAALVVLLVAPDRVGLHGTTPFAQLLALRGLVGAGLVVAAAGLAALPWRRALLPVVAVLVVGAAVQAGVLVDRATGPETAAPADDDLVVLVLNTQDHLTGEAIAALLAEHRPHVAVLPETRSSTAADAAGRAAAAGLDLQLLHDDAGGAPPAGATALLVDRALGTYRVAERLPGRLASFVATGDGAGPPVAAVHPLPPIPGVMGSWRAESAAAVAGCPAGGIAAGDLNATLDHPAFDRTGSDRGCVDAAAQAGAAHLGTWPVGLPPLLAAPIDHVLVDPDAWRVVEVSVLEPPDGTDHRAVLARLAAVGG